MAMAAVSEVRVRHIMADGTELGSMEEVKAHVAGKALPELTQRLVLDFIERGQKRDKQ